MSTDRNEQTAYAGRKRPDEAVDELAPPGQMPVVLAALSIGVLLMGVQLWMLTVALELYLAGKASQVWQLVLFSGAIFAGGLLMLWLLGRRPRVRRGPTSASVERGRRA